MTINPKELVAEALSQRVQEGDILGLGSGTTVELAVEKIGKRIRETKLRVQGIPTSYRIAMIAKKAGIEVLSPYGECALTWAVDGADEVDPAFNMIKGRGAAMLPEKIQARRAGSNLVIVVTEDKMVERLGKSFPIPVEIVPEAASFVEKELARLGAKKVLLREGNAKYGPTVTEHGHMILDAWFDTVSESLENEIKILTGVVESGLFWGLSPEIFVVRGSEVWSERSGARGLEKKVVLKA